MSIKEYALRLLRRVLRIFERVNRYNIYIGDNRILTKTWFDTKMILNTNDRGVTPCILMYGSFELGETKFIRRYLKPNMVFVDVGANFGYFSVHAGRFIKGVGKIIAFEPCPSVFAYLRENCDLNGFQAISHLHMKAVSDKIGEADFWVPEQYFTNSSLDQKCASHYFKDEPLTKLTVATTTLDHELKDEIVDLIKIDAEGHELEILRGGKDFFTSPHAPDVMLEYYRPFGEEKANDLLTLIRDYGYTVSYVTPSGRARSISIEKLKSEHKCLNLFLTK